MTRYGDWSQKARQLTEETDRNGATYYKQAQEMIRKYDMGKTQHTPQMFLALGAMVMLSPHIHEFVAICCALYMFWRIYKLDKN